MVLGKIRKAWQKRARRRLIEKVGKEDWCIFVKALCGSSDSCGGFPYECKCCFDNYFTPNKKKSSLDQFH
jgi:hypothetical protein